jgi:hypothetical protein
MREPHVRASGPGQVTHAPGHAWNRRCVGPAVLDQHYLVGVARITDSACSASFRCVCNIGK